MAKQTNKQDKTIGERSEPSGSLGGGTAKAQLASLVFSPHCGAWLQAKSFSNRNNG